MYKRQRQRGTAHQLLPARAAHGEKVRRKAVAVGNRSGPVSYTHLDVYKRQRLLGADGGERMVPSSELKKGDVVMVSAGGVIPVSYTHLDVYKRQR